MRLTRHAIRVVYLRMMTLQTFVQITAYSLFLSLQSYANADRPAILTFR